jgi:hypothetical protein
MKISNTAFLIVASTAVFAVGGLAAWMGFRYGRESAEPVSPEPVVAETVTLPAKAKPEPDPLPEITDADIEALIQETETAPAPNPGREAMEARQKRWEKMSLEQRALLRKSMFSALAKVEGLEEVGDAIRQGKIDPRSFNINPEALADKMEFLAETMDQEAMETEVSRTLQSIVDQARSQLK